MHIVCVTVCSTLIIEVIVFQIITNSEPLPLYYNLKTLAYF